MIDIMDKSFPLLPSQNPLKGEKPYLFDATLRPNTSLRPKGFILLMVAIASVSFFAGMVFIMLGAWPVMGFFSLDVALIYLAFRANYRWARIYETVRLTQDNLLVEKVNSLGKVQRYQFQPYWLRVSIDESAQNDSRLVLASHGKCMRIGSFLSPDERVQLAHALTDALANLRSPEYRKRAYYAVDPEYAGESS